MEHTNLPMQNLRGIKEDGRERLNISLTGNFYAEKALYTLKFI